MRSVSQPGSPEERWIGSKCVSTPLNFKPSVLKQFSFPKKLELYDVTCRDGEQRPGVVFRKEDKVTIAKKLDEVKLTKGFGWTRDKVFDMATEAIAYARDHGLHTTASHRGREQGIES